MGINLIPAKPKRYVPITTTEPYQEQKPISEEEVIKPQVKSKVLVIDNISITINQEFDNNLEFKVNTIPGTLSNNFVIPSLDICAKEDIEFDESFTLSRLESIIRRCGVLEQYSDYLTNDPDIVINSYTLNIKRTYTYFNEFKEGVLIGEEIFM